VTAGSSRTAASPVASSATGRPHWTVFLGLASAIVVADQLTKAWVVANIEPGEAIRVVGDLLRLVHSQNTGALFGLFRDNAILFGAASILVIALIVAFHGRSGRSLATSILLGLLLGGAVGNLIDRLRLGYVVDFVDAGIGDLRFYTFNVADAAISTAIAGLILLAIFPGLGEAVDRLGRRAPTDSPSVEG
jgi:signal peptidase II